MTHQTDTARELSRENTGRFGVQQHSAPETALPGHTPKQLAAAGFGGPASVNVFAEPWDKDESRPLRPYLPLSSGDDDEFFDAHPGSSLTIVDGVNVRTFTCTGEQFTWEERSHRGNVVRTVSSGELWLDLFNEDGSMRSALLHAPVGTLFSDQHYFVARDVVDKPLTVDDAIYRLSGARRGELVSRSTFGDMRLDGIPPVYHGELAIDVTDTGRVTYHRVGARSGEKRVFTLDNVDIFDRDGDIVFRQEKDGGFGWEESVRLGDGYDRLPWAHDHENLCDESRMSGRHPERSASKETEDDYWDPRV